MARPEDNERLRRWNERYARREETHDHQPSPFLAAAIEGVPPGVALDLACGAGRHALFLAERGWRVVAVDGARVGVELLLQEARRRGVTDRIETHVADLMSRPRGFTIEPERYDLVCDFYFLDRSLFEDIRRGVKPGGRLVAAIHVSTNGEPADRLLQPGELRRLIDAWGWTTLFHEEGASGEEGHEHGTAHLIARRP